MSDNSNRRSNRRNSKRKLVSAGLSYDALENRQLLAAIVLGGSGNDKVELTYVDANTVNILTNETLRENVDVSNGLRVNLGSGNDSVLIDHRITADMHIANTERLHLDGGDNDWKIGSRLNISSSTGESGSQFEITFPRRIVIGQINDNIRFVGAGILQSGSGVDTFTGSFDSNVHLEILAGDGDDVFRVNRDVESTGSSLYGFNSFQIKGEAGNDRFVFFGSAEAKAIGGEGDDVVDYRQRGGGVIHQVAGVRDGQWQDSIEKVIAPVEGENLIFTALQSKGTGLSWVVKGSQTVLTDAGSGQSMEFLNFNQFRSDSHAIDRFWVLATTEDISIVDADFVQISSTLDASVGTLETIEHDVTLTRIGTQLYRHPTLTENATGNFAATSDDDGVIHPEVVISDRGNDEETFGFVDGREIRGIAPGNINFVDTRVGSGTESDSGDDLLIAPFFQPDVTIHGTELGDSFLVASTLFPVTIESHGGNDAVMIGSSNAAANGNLNEIDARLNLKTGAGQDRIFVNDQAFDTREVGYRLSTSGIKDVVKYPSVRDTILDDVAAYPNHFADINFEGVEFARVNGSATQKNSFLVLPSTFTRFFVDGIAQTNTEDTVTVLGFSESRSLIHENGDGAFTFEEDALQVHFAGIEDVNQTSFVSVDGFFEGSLEPFE